MGADKDDMSKDDFNELLFGDAGSATALESNNTANRENWYFSLHTDGTGYSDLIIKGGGFRDRFPKDPNDCFVQMSGANIFKFTISRIPALVDDTLESAGLSKEDIDYFIFGCFSVLNADHDRPPFPDSFSNLHR